MRMSRKFCLYTALGAFALFSGCSKEENPGKIDVPKETLTDAQAVTRVNEKLAKGELKLDVNVTAVREKDSTEEAYKAELAAKSKEEIRKVNVALGEYEAKKAELQRAKDTKASDETIAELERKCEESKANFERLEARRQAEMRRIIRARKLKADAKANSEAYKKLVEEEKAKAAR